MYLSRSQSRSWQYLTICIFRTIIRAAMIPLEGEGFGPDLIKDYFKGKPKWSGQGRHLNTRVQAISGKPEQNSKFLFIVNILGYLKSTMSMVWSPFWNLFSLRWGLFWDPMPTYIWTPAEGNWQMEWRPNHTHSIPKVPKNINYEDEFRILFRFYSYCPNDPPRQTT